MVEGLKGTSPKEKQDAELDFMGMFNNHRRKDKRCHPELLETCRVKAGAVDRSAAAQGAQAWVII